MRRSKWRKREFLMNQVDFQRGLFSFGVLFCTLEFSEVVRVFLFSSCPAPKTPYLCHFLHHPPTWIHF